MRQSNRIVLAASLLLAAAGLRAAASETCDVTLPEIGPEMNGIIDSVKFWALITDAAGKPAGIPVAGATWKPSPKAGEWRDQRGSVISRLSIPLGKSEGVPGLNVQVEQGVSFRTGAAGSPLQHLTVKQLLPLPGGGAGVIAPFLVDLVTIDGSSVTWGTKGGVAGIGWSIKESAAPARMIKGEMKATGQKVAVALVRSASPLTANLTFICVGGKMIRWADDGADLRVSGLKVVLAGDPGCPQKH